MAKKKEDFTGLNLLLNQQTRRGKPGKLRSDLADAGTAIAPARGGPGRDGGDPPQPHDFPEGDAGAEAISGEWDESDFDFTEDDEDLQQLSRPRTRVNRKMLHVRLALSVHRLMTDFLAEQKMSMQEFMIRIVAMELRQRIPERARRLRVPSYSPLNLQRTQAYLPKAMHTALKNRALEYDMSLQDLVTRLILYRVKRGRRPRPSPGNEPGS